MGSRICPRPTDIRNIFSEWKDRIPGYGEAGREVAEALRIVDKAFEQGGGIELWLKSKGWDVERSMMCPHMEGRIDWNASKIEEDVPDKNDEKRIVDTEKRD